MNNHQSNSSTSQKNKRIRITYSKEDDQQETNDLNNSNSKNSKKTQNSTNNSTYSNNSSTNNPKKEPPSIQIQQPTNPMITINETNSNLQLGKNTSSLLQENSLNNNSLNRRMSYMSNASNSVPINNQNFVSHRNYPYSNDYEDIFKDSKKVFLGKGGFGIVKLVKHKQSGEKRALKTIKKDSLGKDDPARIMAEIKIMMKMNHPNILKIYEYYEDSENLYLITEHCTGGNLFDQIISKGTRFNEFQACKMMRSLMGAIKYAHSLGVVHRDIKPENILIDFIEEQSDQQITQQTIPMENKKFIIKLIDWGLSTYFDRTANRQLTDCCGTPFYIAPEVIQRQHDEKADIWSCGVVLYVLLSGSPPFEGINTKEVISNIQNKPYSFRYDCWKQVHPSVKHLLKKMLTKDPEKRISAEAVLEHPWFEHFTTESQQNINTQSLEKTFTRLSQFNSTVKLQKAVIQFIASHLTPKYERMKLQELFLKLDTNNDGVLTLDEIVVGYQKLFSSKEQCEIAIQNIMDKLDADQDGTINQTEFIAGTMDIKNVINETNLRQAFSLFDKDDDGQITANEIKNILGGEYDIDNEQWDEIVKEVDENDDGNIDYQEFKKIMTKFATESITLSQQQEEQ